ncbi:MAG: hypothetical protein ACHBN1_20125 [Heteroscytonema crispum UTEX LB 1556]
MGRAKRNPTSALDKVGFHFVPTPLATTRGTRFLRSGSPTYILPTTHQRDRASPVLGGKPSRSTRFTTNPRGVHQSPGSGKRHLLHLGRPQDRSGSPTKGAKLTGGNLLDCRRKRPFTNHQPPTTIYYLLTTNQSKYMCYIVYRNKRPERNALPF